MKVIPAETLPRKPDWIRVRMPANAEVGRIRNLLREHSLSTVCEEASCPNLGECFGHGTATFMILGDICTRRCPFCDVAHGRPMPPDPEEPVKLASAVSKMQLKYVVITSVDRDDLDDSGAGHFADCIKALREQNDSLQIEILTPDFKGREDKALAVLESAPPDIFNHNLETVPRLYKKVRPGADYKKSLLLLRNVSRLLPHVPTKSGLMLGLGEEISEVLEVMEDLRSHGVSLLTLGQYLQPTRNHLPVNRFVHPDEFSRLKEEGLVMGFTHVASGPLVRSSYHADLQARGEL